MHNPIPLFAMLMVFGIPLVAILTSHQRKMAMILHQNAREVGMGRTGSVEAETRMLREEIQELKSLIHQQSIALDSLRQTQPVETRRRETVEA